MHLASSHLSHCFCRPQEFTLTALVTIVFAGKTCVDDGTVGTAECNAANRETVGNYATKECTQTDGGCDVDDCCGGDPPSPKRPVP